MSLQAYRYYCLDSTGHLHSAEWFEADNDEQATAIVEQMHPDGRCEVWQGPQLVARLLPHRLTA